MDAKALNRALTTARSIDDIERALRGRDALLNAINCAAACGSAAKLSASRAGKFTTAATTVEDAKRVIMGVCDMATSAMSHEPRQWWPRQCSAMLWALGKVGARHKGLEEAIEVALEPRLDECKPQELSNALWGLAKVNSDRVGLIRMLGERIRRSLLVDKGTDHRTGWTTQGVSNAAWSLGSMTTDALREMFEESALGEELVRGLATAVEERVLMFNPQECANTLWAFAKCSAFTNEAERGARAIAARIRDEEHWMVRGDFQCQHVSNVTWACAKMNMSDDKKLVDVLSAACKAYASDLNAQELSMILWALATLAISDHTTMDELANAAAEKAKESSAQQMATSAHALAKLGIYNAPLMNAYKFHATQRRDEFQPRDVAFLAWAYAKLEIKAPKLFEMFSQVAGDMLYDPDYQTFTPHHLTMLLWSFAMLSEDTEALLPVVVRAMATMLDDFNSRDLTNTAWALAAIGCDDKTFISSIGACAKKKLNEFNSQELLKFLGSYERLGVEDKALTAAVSARRTLTYEFPALDSTVELTAATPQSYKGTDRVRVDDSCGGWGRGNTGVALWEGSFVLAEWLSRQKTPHSTAGIKESLEGAWGKDAIWSDKVGVELGAGLGLPSIVASELGVQMVATDGDDDVLTLLRENIARNAKNSARVEKLVWGVSDPLKTLGLKSHPDLVVASDVVYGNDPAKWTNLVRTMCDLSGPKTLILIANVQRYPVHHPMAETKFYTESTATDFTRAELPVSALHTDFQRTGAGNCVIHVFRKVANNKRKGDKSVSEAKAKKAKKEKKDKKEKKEKKGKKEKK